MSVYLGDFPEDFAGLTFCWGSNAIAGESITRATNGTISVYKDGGTTQSTAGITDTEDFDSLTGVHKVLIDTSADAFYSAGSEYAVILSAATIDGKTINTPLAHFSIERAGGILALLKGGTNGLAAIKTAINTVDDFVDTEIADIQSRLPAALVSGRMDSHVGAMATNAISPAAVSSSAATKIGAATWEELTSAHTTAGTYGKLVTDNLTDILVDTAVIGAAGAGLTAIPWNASWDAEVESEVTDALNAYDPPTKAELDTAVLNVSVDEIQATALADLFNTDSGTTYASSVAGSVVKEIADNAGGASLTLADIADAVWDEATTGHTTAGTTGKALTDAGSAGDPWSTALPGAYGAGTAGKIIGDNINATVSSRATQTSVDTIDDFLDTEVASVLAAVDTEVAAILADTNELQTDWVDGGRLDLILDARASQTSVNTIDDFLDTEVAAILAAVDTEVSSILADTNELQTDWANGGRLDNILDARASQTSVDTLDDFVDAEVAAIKAKTDQLTFTVANQLDANIQYVNDVAVTGNGQSGTEWGP